MNREAFNTMISLKNADDHLRSMVQSGKSDQLCIEYIKNCGAYIINSQDDISDILRHTKGLIFAENYSGDDIVDP